MYVHQNRTESFLVQLFKTEGLRTLPRRMVYYEELQSQKYIAMSDIICHPLRPSVSTKTNLHSESSSGWRKRTTEDLSIVLSNYQEIKTYLTQTNQSMFLRQLISKQSEIFIE